VVASVIYWRILLARSEDRPGEYVILMVVVFPQATASLTHILAADVRDCLFGFPIIHS